jgi:hypothetical protein
LSKSKAPMTRLVGSTASLSPTAAWRRQPAVSRPTALTSKPERPVIVSGQSSGFARRSMEPSPAWSNARCPGGSRHVPADRGCRGREQDDDGRGVDLHPVRSDGALPSVNRVLTSDRQLTCKQAARFDPQAKKAGFRPPTASWLLAQHVGRPAPPSGQDPDLRVRIGYWVAVWCPRPARRCMGERARHLTSPPADPFDTLGGSL